MDGFSNLVAPAGKKGKEECRRKPKKVPSLSQITGRKERFLLFLEETKGGSPWWVHPSFDIQVCGMLWDSTVREPPCLIKHVCRRVPRSYPKAKPLPGNKAPPSPRLLCNTHRHPLK